MSQRTTTDLVKELLGANYGKLPNGTLPSLQPYIDSATLLINKVATCAVQKGSALSTAELEILERWMSAHYYTRMDPTYTSRSTNGASGSFTSPKDDTERYRASAVELDTSGCLKTILNRNVASTSWAGKIPSEQTDYVYRR